MSLRNSIVDTGIAAICLAGIVFSGEKYRDYARRLQVEGVTNEEVVSYREKQENVSTYLTLFVGGLFASSLAAFINYNVQTNKK